ncbi:MAG: NAD(+)/NADH kinase [Ignavibacteriales bacterium]|nr:NAD(+)/NADH kinase [Ignavibacteriales bacterium]
MKLGLVGNLEKKELPQIVQKLLQEVKTEFLIVEPLAKAVKRSGRKLSTRNATIVSERKLLAKAEMVIALGGDGTILRTARFVGARAIPILGINLGKLGFLAEVSVEELESCVEDVLNGRYTVEERMMLQATSQGLQSPFFALNDVVVDKYGTSRVMHIETYVNKEYLATYSADGIIVSTPTGSTAYSLANGGPIVAPESRAVTINPICPHTLTARPVIIPDDSVVSIRISQASQKVHLTADGQSEKLFRPPVTFTVKKAPFNAKLVKRLNTSYYDVLRKKLNWGSDVRINPKGS